MKKVSLLFIIGLSAFFNSFSQYVLNGNASLISGNEYQLTPENYGQGGSLWYQTRLNLNYNFTISAQLYLGVLDADGADGAAFVLQPLNTGLGGVGGGLGYQGITPSLDVEFDTWQNDDPAEDHLAINKNGDVNHTGANVLLSPFLLPNIEDGNWHPAVFSWNAATTTLTVTFDGVPHSIVYNLVGNIFGGSPFAYWGFTAGTGAAINDQRVRIDAIQFVEEISITGIVANAPCQGPTGGVDITVTGGTGGYTYAWTGPNLFTSTSEDLTGVPAGAYTVTVTDNSHISKSQSFAIAQLPDNTPPTITCPQPITVSNDVGICGAVVNYSLPTVTDNCSALPYSIAGYTNKGIYNNHAYFLSNTFANAHTANTASNALGGHLATISDAAENSFIAAIYGGLMWIGFTDEVAQGTTEGNFIWVTHEPVTYTNWNPPLEPNNQGDENWTVFNWGASGKWNDWNYLNNALYLVEFDGRFPITQTAGLPSGAVFPVGTTTNTFVTHDLAGNTASCSFTITVTDDENPKVFCPADVNHGADPSKCSYTFTPTAATATDNCPGVTVAGVRDDAAALNSPYPVGQTIITWTATDASGHTASCLQRIIISDNEDPKIQCPNNVYHTADGGICSYSFIPTQAGAIDNCPGVTVAGVRNDVQPLNSPYPVGTTTITWTATDAHGRQVSCVQTVTVTDDENPKITCPNTFKHGADLTKCSYTFAPPPPAATDNCPGVAVTGVRSDAKPLSDPYPVGNTTITWTATDTHGHSISCLQTVTITDDELPIAKCKNATVTLVGGLASITVANINNGSTDNCGVRTVTVAPTTFTCANAGDNTVTLTVTDIHDNVNTCTAIVTVVGSIPSCTITAIPNNNIYTGGIPTNLYLGYGPTKVTLNSTVIGGTSPYTYSWTGNGTLSCTNCAAPVFAPTAAGTYNFTLTVTNKYGCKTTCTIRICVLDIRVPSSKNVYICHVPNGDINNPQTLTISTDGVPAHIPGDGSHALDHLGKCSDVPCGATNRLSTPLVNEESTTTRKVSVLPNPSNGEFKLRLKDMKGSSAEVTILNANGATIEKRIIQIFTEENTILFNLKKQASGMYYIRIISADGTFSEKVVIQR